MAKNKEQKKRELEKIEAAFKGAKSLVLIDYFGLKVKEINQLRKMAKTMGGEYFVAKKTLFKLALKNLGLSNECVEKISSGVGLVFGYQDEIAPAKLILKFSQEHEKVKILAGLFDKNFITPEEVRFLAKLPSREQLLIQLVWMIRTPLTGLVNVCQANLRNLVYALNALYLIRNKN